jgi:5'-3' exonuclease/transcription antitermination factor NusG
MSSDIQWVVLELTAKADGEDPDVIAASIRHLIRDAEVFVPASVVQREAIREVRYLVDGYAFIKHRHPDGHYVRLEDTKFVQSPLYQATGSRREKRLATVSDRQIETLRAQIVVEVDQGIEVGDSVLITSGPYKNIKATVREEIHEQESVVVYIHLRSTDRLVTLPRAFLKLESKSPHIALRERLRRLDAWISTARVLARVPDFKLYELHRRLAALNKLQSWVGQSVALYRWINALYTPIEFEPLLKINTDYERLESLVSRLRAAKAEPAAEPAPGLNLIIDGTQLFVRCAEAGGLTSLTDKQGRPTGDVVGLLRSVAAYRRRFPQGSVYICWDGSSKRRKRMYDSYKGSRTSRFEPPFGWSLLREVLPLLGVHQAFNVDEEADDVMASLVRGLLRQSTNVVITSDRDLLQVVSEFTHQLVPGSVGCREKLYDPAMVESEYGVAPGALVQLRALSGDPLDHIPGVPGFGLKTAGKVLKPYGTVGALLRSNLAGITKTQAANLRASAKQVTLNVALMTLQAVPVTMVPPDPRPEAARIRLKAMGINRPDGILSAFFGPSLGVAEAIADAGL